MAVHSSPFLLDVERIRREARSSLASGAVTPGYQLDVAAVLALLDGALATEWLCVLRYSQHAIAAKGIHAETVAAEFEEHAREELGHAQKIAVRINQLGGTPRLDPSTFASRGHSSYVECDSLGDMIRENLVAERIAIEAYGEMIRYLGDKDVTTRRMIESILEVEEEHAEDMADLLAQNEPPQARAEEEAQDKLN